MTGVHIVAIVAIVFGTLYAIFDKIYKHGGNKKDDQELDQLRAELGDLKERFAVLEKIVTDEKYDLKKEFDKL